MTAGVLFTQRHEKGLIFSKEKAKNDQKEQKMTKNDQKLPKITKNYFFWSIEFDLTGMGIWGPPEADKSARRKADKCFGVVGGTNWIPAPPIR